MYEAVQQTPEQMAFFHLGATCQLSLADMPLTWLQAGEKCYREWLVDQEGDEIKMIGCFKATNTGHQSRQWRGCIYYPGGQTERMHVAWVLRDTNKPNAAMQLLTYDSAWALASAGGVSP
jgi:hypothetical protein